MSKIIQIKSKHFDVLLDKIVKETVSQVKAEFSVLLSDIYVKKEDPNELVPRIPAANFLQISLVKLWQITKDKVIPVTKIGGKVLYKKSDLLEFVNSNSSK